MGEEQRTDGQSPGWESRHRPLFELATRQHGVVTTRQLDGLGYSPSSAAKAAKAGRLRRLHRGVYAVGHEPLTWHGRCMAAVLAARPAVASHRSAAWLWGLIRLDPARIDVAAPTRRRGKREFRVHFAELSTRDRGELDRIPVTSLARTQLDLAGRGTATQVERNLRRAEELGVFDLTLIEDVLDRNRHHPGATKLSRALAIYRPDPAFTRSKLERRFQKLIREAGLPAPAANYVVAGFELDAYWEPERFGVELDVYETHGSHGAFEGDRLRDDDLLLAGVETIRVTGPRLDREPEATIARVAAHLERRRRELARPGPGPGPVDLRRPVGDK